MKILIFGAGVIGSIYGYTLMKAGFDVTHYVRSHNTKKVEEGISLKLLDARNKKSVNNICDTYFMKVVEELPSFNDFDLVIVSVRHYQLDSVLPIISKKIGKADILFFNHLWTDFENIDKYVPREKYLWGFPSAGGGFSNKNSNKLNGVINRSISLGEVNGQITPRVERITTMFNKANIKVDYQKNILHWLWKQFALNAGISSMIAKAGGAEQFLSNFSNIHQGVLCMREILSLCKLRGVNIKEFGDANAFFLPSWLATFGLWFTLKRDVPQRTIFQLYNGADEMKEVYYHVMDMSKKLNVNMPKVRALKEYVDRAEELFL